MPRPVNLVPIGRGRAMGGSANRNLKKDKKEYQWSFIIPDYKCRATARFFRATIYLAIKVDNDV